MEGGEIEYLYFGLTSLAKAMKVNYKLAKYLQAKNISGFLPDLLSQ